MERDRELMDFVVLRDGFGQLRNLERMDGREGDSRRDIQQVDWDGDRKVKLKNLMYFTALYDLDNLG